MSPVCPEPDCSLVMHRPEIRARAGERQRTSHAASFTPPAGWRGRIEAAPPRGPCAPLAAYAAALAAAAWDLSPRDVLSDSRAREPTRARQLAAYAAARAGRSFSEIGRRLRRDHSTVMHAWRRIEQERVRTPELDACAAAIGARLTPLRLEKPS